MKIIVIDLLNKIANGEEVPKYVEYYNMLKDKIDIMMVCIENIIYKLDRSEIQLNSRVNPVEEEKKIPEKLIPASLKGIDNLDEKIEIAHIDTVSVIETVNQLIDYLNSKGE